MNFLEEKGKELQLQELLQYDPEVILAMNQLENLDSKTGERIINMFIDLNKKRKNNNNDYT